MRFLENLKSFNKVTYTQHHLGLTKPCVSAGPVFSFLGVTNFKDFVSFKGVTREGSKTFPHFAKLRLESYYSGINLPFEDCYLWVWNLSPNKGRWEKLWGGHQTGRCHFHQDRKAELRVLQKIKKLKGCWTHGKQWWPSGKVDIRTGQATTKKGNWNEKSS